MPVIVYKTLEITAIYAQMRHIACEHCQQPFSYLAVGTHSTQTTGLPLVSSDEGMRETAKNQLIKALEGVGEKRRLGQALCPHCQRYQGWMVRWSWLSAWAKGLFGGALAGLILGVVLLLVVGLGMGVSKRSPAPFFVVGIALGVAGGAAWAWKNSLSTARYEGMADSRAMTTNELSEFMAMCKEKDFEPSLAWYASSGGQFDPRFPVVPLPPKDESGL